VHSKTPRALWHAGRTALSFEPMAHGHEIRAARCTGPEP
jgi:hypothetical protein